MPRYTAIPTATARRYQQGGADAYGNPPERHQCDTPGNPCRHCLREIPPGAQMLILAHKPFSTDQPYAETGPVFLCAEPCEPPPEDAGKPAVFGSPDYLLKAYRADERIYYGTGRVVPAEQMTARAAVLLADPDVAFVDVRSAMNNCWQARVVRDAD